MSSLKKVLSGIPISIGDFFTLDLANIQPDLAVFPADKMPEVGNTQWSRKLVGAGVMQRLADFTRERFAPGLTVVLKCCRVAVRKPGWLFRAVLS
ncbi:hypothetical protein [Aliamphritea spongicola]